MIPIQLLGLSNNRNLLMTSQQQRQQQARNNSDSDLLRRKAVGGRVNRASLKPTMDLIPSSSDHQFVSDHRSHSLITASGVQASGGYGTRFSQGFSYIRRRFSSNDVSDEKDAENLPPGTKPTNGFADSPVKDAKTQDSSTVKHERSEPAGPPPAGYAAHRPPAPTDDTTAVSGAQRPQPRGNAISAPTSPSKHRQPPNAQPSMYSQVQGITKNLFNAATGANLSKQLSYDPSKSKCLLVIDDYHTDWSKYFRHKKVLNDMDVRVEQAAFSEIGLVSHSENGCAVEINSSRTGAHQTRSFRPDFVLVRQAVRTEKTDHRQIVIGLLFGAVPALNSLHSIYNFYDKPWVFAHLLMIQKRLGRDKFPLIDQSYYPSSVTQHQGNNLRYPMVVKIGSGHKGLGKIKVYDADSHQDVASLTTLTQMDATAEPFVDAKYDMHLQKIGASYKAFMRKGISGHWKGNIGSSMLEQIAMTDRYKLWVDKVAELFGGLDICSVEVLVGQDGREVILGANDCSFTLLGETQEEDRRLIAELALTKMNITLDAKQLIMNNPGSPPTTVGAGRCRGSSISSEADEVQRTLPPVGPRPPLPARPQAAVPQQSGGSPAPVLTNGAGVSHGDETSMVVEQDTQEDTMGSLKKTFAGIFGDI